MSLTQGGARLVYKNAQDALIKAGVNPASAVLSQSYLRFETFLSTTKTSYDFGVLNNQTPNGIAQAPTENRLALQDAFYISELMVYIATASSPTDSSYRLWTYPDTEFFNNNSLYTLYNGQLSLTVNNRQIVPSSDLIKYLQVPQTQNNQSIEPYTIAQFDGSFANVIEPNLVLIGSKNSLINITLPSALTGMLSPYTKVVIVARGILAQNVTVVS
jgi:hypothetical protein